MNLRRVKAVCGHDGYAHQRGNAGAPLERAESSPELAEAGTEQSGISSDEASIAPGYTPAAFAGASPGTPCP